MEARMDEDDILSMMRALLEAQQRGMASQPTNHHGTNAHEYQRTYDEGYQSWEPTGNDGFDGSSDYHGDLYANEHPRGYDSGYHSWEPTCDHGWDGSTHYQGGLPTEANQRGYDEGYQTWQPTTDHGFEPSSDYHGELYAPAHRSGYEEASQSWNMQYDNGGPYSSPISIQEDHYNMMQLLLEGQARHNDLINSLAFGMPSTTPTAAATAHVEPFSHNLTTTPWTDEDDSDCMSVHETSPMEVPPIATDGRFEEIATLKDDFLQETEWTPAEFENLLGCTVDETLVLHYAGNVDSVVPLRDSPMSSVVCDAPRIGGFVVDGIGNARERTTEMYELSPKGILHVHTTLPLLVLASPLDDASKAAPASQTPMAPPFAKPLASNPPTAAPIGHPWRLPFEHIRMKEFGGWFYDEYDPGDPRFRRVHLDTSTWDFSQA